MTQPLIDSWRLIAGLAGLIAVLVGAVASHVLTEGQAVIAVERASNYQLIHAVILAVTTLMTGKLVGISRWCFSLGILLFSGSIYLKYIFGLLDATKIAPTGGLLLMLGWLCLAISAKARAK